MSKNIKKTSEQDLMTLYEKLEESYGLVLAQQIVDEIRKAENLAYVPDYVGAKSVSEAVEFIRPKAREALKSLKQAKLEEAKLPDGVESLNVKRAEQDFVRLFGAYLLVKGVYWDFYTRIMTDIEKQRYVPKRYPETAIIGKAA